MRRAASTMALAATLASAAESASVQVHPGPAPAGVEHFAQLQNEFPDPCVIWQLREIQGGRIVLQGVAPAAGAHCPNVEQIVPLGALAAGRYTLEARVAATGALHSRLVFAVGGGSFDPEVAVLPTRPSPGSPVALGVSLVNSFCYSVMFPSPPEINGDRITFEGQSYSLPILCPPSNWFEGFFFTIPALSPGRKTVEFVVENQLVADLSFTVAAPTERVILSDGFQVEVAWRDGGGVQHAASAIRLTEESAEFTFFDAANVELVVKILDGRGLNDHFWVFAASMTDLPYTLTVTDYLGSHCDISGSPLPCPRRVYEGPAGVNRNVLDTRAFPVPE